jgi:hypothetical protein
LRIPQLFSKKVAILATFIYIVLLCIAFWRLKKDDKKKSKNWFHNHHHFGFFLLFLPVSVFSKEVVEYNFAD